MMSEISHDQIVAAYQAVAASEAGRIMLADLEVRFGFTTRSMFDRNDMSGLLLANREGQRSVLAHIGRVIETPVGQATKGDTHG
jgi:hypothetical protein